MNINQNLKLSLTIIIFISSFSLITLACTSLRNNQSSIPQWYVNKPQEQDYLYGTGVMQGIDLGLTRAGSVALSKDDIASQLKVTFLSVIESEKYATNGNQNIDTYKKWTMQTISETLKGCDSVDEIVLENDSKYTVYVLTRMPRSNLSKELKLTVKNPVLLKDLQNRIAYDEADID